MERGGTEDSLFEGAKKIEFQYWNSERKQWEDEWDTTRSERRFKLPLFVKFELKLPMPNGQMARTFTTQSRIMLQDALAFGPNICLN